MVCVVLELISVFLKLLKKAYKQVDYTFKNKAQNELITVNSDSVIDLKGNQLTEIKKWSFGRNIHLSCNIANKYHLRRFHLTSE